MDQEIEIKKLESKRSVDEEREKIKRSCFYAKSRFERIVDEQTSRNKDHSYCEREPNYLNKTVIEPKSEMTKTVRNRSENNPPNKTSLWVKTPQSFIPREDLDMEWERLLERRKRYKEGLKLTQV
jgi:hypothetical protein